MSKQADYTAAQAAVVAGVTVQTVWEWCRSGRVRSRRERYRGMRRRFVIAREDLERFLEGGEK